MLFRSDRKSTRLNSSHTIISYAVFCLKKKPSPRPSRLPARLSARRPLGSAAAGARAAVMSSGGVLGCRPAEVGAVSQLVFFLKTGGPRDYPLFPYPALSQ